MAINPEFEFDLPEDQLLAENLPKVGEPPEEFDVTGWSSEGKELANRETKNKWDIGAWLVKGEPHYPDPIDVQEAPPQLSYYRHAAEITGLAPSTLKDIASTYKRAASVRTEGCSWSHHRVLVNAIPKASDETLKQWLNRAVEEKMSVVALKEAINASPRTQKSTRSFRVTVPLSVWEMLKDLADHDHSTPQEIAAKWLEQNANLDDVKALHKFAKKMIEQSRTERRREVGRKVARAYDSLHVQQ